MYRYLLTLLILLAACATPQERCAARQAKDMRAIDDLIATTAANVERGYALETRHSITTGITLCTGRHGRGLFCAGTQTAPKKTPVAIDLAAEQRKLAQLKAKRAELQRQADQKIAICVAAKST